MATNQSNWLWDANVFGEQAPNSTTPTAGTYPVCGRQQERNWALENMLFGLENVIAPALTAIKDNLQSGVSQGNIATVTDKLTLTGGYDSLPTTKLDTYINNLSTSYNTNGFCIKTSLYNPTTNASVTIINNSTEGFLLEAGVALELDYASTLVNLSFETPANASATGTNAQTIYITYSVLCIPQ